MRSRKRRAVRQRRSVNKRIKKAFFNFFCVFSSFFDFISLKKAKKNECKISFLLCFSRAALNSKRTRACERTFGSPERRRKGSWSLFKEELDDKLKGGGEGRITDIKEFSFGGSWTHQTGGTRRYPRIERSLRGVSVV